MLRGAGHQTLGFGVNLICFWAIGIPTATYLDLGRHQGPAGLWMAMAGVSALQAAVLALAAARFDWQALARRAHELVQSGQGQLAAGGELEQEFEEEEDELGCGQVTGGEDYAGGSAASDSLLSGTQNVERRSGDSGHFAPGAAGDWHSREGSAAGSRQQHQQQVFCREVSSGATSAVAAGGGGPCSGCTDLAVAAAMAPHWAVHHHQHAPGSGAAASSTPESQGHE